MKIRDPNLACRHPRAQLPGHRRADPFFRALLWRALGSPACRLSLHNMYAFRRLVFSACGARIHPTVKIWRTARVDCPWNLAMGELSVLGDHASVCARAPVRVGARCTISQLVKIFTLARDGLSPGFETYTAPVEIRDDAWIAADVLVMPGVTIDQGAVVGARSHVDRSLASWRVCAGEPATPRRPRRFDEAA